MLKFPVLVVPLLGMRHVLSSLVYLAFYAALRRITTYSQHCSGR